jgi:hypothetical protein
MNDVLERLKNYIRGENDDCVAERIAEAITEIERLRAIPAQGVPTPDAALSLINAGIERIENDKRVLFPDNEILYMLEDIRTALSSTQGALTDKLAWAKVNHTNVVERKRITDARLQIALAALQQIYDASSDDWAVKTAGDAFNAATHETPPALSVPSTERK